ncbi:hypothetical protein [Ornithinimicrobium panacihumi]|uniref:hypothetical protein n=1 Tax=Ornithinimicrobium panacihumi TaxID=2008449 RepID=UPI003F891CFF
MAVIALTSASGSPGVTTTALGLALSRSRPTLLVDADPTGGSAYLAGYLRGQVTPPDALIDLYMAFTQGRLREVLPQVLVPIPDSKVSLIPGMRSHVQAAALKPLWDPLLSALKALAGTGQDVIVDLGRLGLTGSASQIARGADLTLLVVRSDLVALAGARSWASTIASEAEEVGAGSTTGLLVVGPGRPYAAKEIPQVLGLPLIASVEWDPKAAAAFSAGQQVRKLGQSGLVRSLQRADTSIAAAIAQGRAELVVTETEGGV